LFRTVSVIATGADLRDRETNAPGVKVFVSVLKLTGTALVAVFTAIVTQYLVRAKLGGAFEARKIPDGGHVVVCGLGNVGFRCVEELVRMKAPVVAVDKVNDNPFAATVRRMGVPVIVGDVTVPEVLRQARVDTAAATIAATDVELINLELALLVRELNPQGRVVVRLTDPGFAAAVREAADIQHAVSVPALAGPAFAAALLGDRIQTLLTVAGRTLAVVDLVVQADDPCLCGQPLLAAMTDYGFLPVTEAEPKAKLLAAGDRVTVIAELPTLDRLLRRETGCK
jgi:Trk K+ transport system NAD-binding subunit